MKKLTRKVHGSYTGVMHEITRKLKARETFFYSDKCDHRFAVPKRTLWAEHQEQGMTFFRMLGESMVKVIDFDRSLVGYEHSTGMFILDECYLTKDLISAVKQAKKKKSAYVVDLRTNKLISTNG